MCTILRRSCIAAAVALMFACASSPPTLTSNDPLEIANQAFDLRVEGQVDEAVALLKAGLAVHPDAGVLHYELARARLLLLDIEAMQKEIEAAVACEPNDSDFRYFAALASAYSLIDAAHHDRKTRLTELGHAILEQLGAALAIDPDHHEARYLLVQQSTDMAPELGIEVEDLDGHVRYLEERDAVLGTKARCCLLDEAEQCDLWDRLLADRPDDVRAHAEAAEGYVTCGRLVDADRCLTRAIDADPSDCYGLLRLGFAYMMKQDWVHAVELTKRYLALEPPPALRAFALARLAQIHRRMGQPDLASDYLAQARDVDEHVWMTMMPPPKEIFTPVQMASR